VPWELGLALPAPVGMVAANERDLGSKPRGVAERKRAASHMSTAGWKLPWPFGGGGRHRAGATERTVLTANPTEWYIRVMFFLSMLFYGATNFW
jgi:hypothetical protein